MIIRKLFIEMNRPTVKTRKHVILKNKYKKTVNL